MNYDVFISYRRDKGAMIARNLQQALSALGLKVFFDMEELTDGKFNEKLYDSIEQSKNVIFLMTEGALDRCVNDGDWVRNELEHVIDKGVNLIPIAPTGTPIEFPEGLPEKLAPLKVLEISELNLEKLFKESVAKIAGRLKDVVLTSDKEKKEAEEAFLSQARRFKGNDGIIDADEMKELLETAKELGISTARRIKLIEQIEQEYVPSSAASLDSMPTTTDVVHSFDVFISYRRVGGSKDAWQMHEQLSKLGYSVCYDMDMLKDGNFNEELLQRVSECKNFVVLLSAGCFDQTLDSKCKRDDDRMRLELATAFYNKKNVVAVMMPDFEMPSKLPPDIDAVRNPNIALRFDKYHVDSFYARLKEKLTNRQDEAKRQADQESADIFSVDALVKERDSSLDELFGEDDLFWREEAEVAYKSVSRLLPYAERKRLDDAWQSAEDNLKNGDHQAATRYYMDVTSIAKNVASCSSPFVTRLIGDGIDTYASDWFAQVLKKAQQGDKDYQYGMGTLYSEGLGIEKNSASAFRWFSRAAVQGHIQAIAAIGAAYASGVGVEVDYRAAKKNLVLAEKHGDMRATERLAYLYENGFGVRRNYAIAVSKYKKAAMNGNTAAMVALGRMLEEGSGIDKDIEKSVSWYRLAVASGNAVAQRKMAGFLFAGKCVEKDEAEAVKLARMAANQGDADAIAILGRAYEDGTGITKDPVKALELYRKAVDAGSILGRLYLSELEPDDQYRNGVKFLEGNGVTQDFVVARRWFEKSAAQSYVPAMEQLGFMSERGLGCQVSIREAKEWYEKASENENAAAMVGLGKMYFRGYDGIEKDYVKATEYFKKAATLWKVTEPENQWKVFYAFFYLGRIYTEGLGTQKDCMLGQRCFLFGANSGNIVCARSLAIDYENGGNGLPKSQKRSSDWYKKCVQLINDGKIRFADDQAMRIVGLLYWFGNGGLKKDGEISRQWMSKSAALGNLQSLRTMGDAYLKGRGVCKDVRRGIELLEGAADRGDNSAQNILSWKYYTGDEVSRDANKAYQWATIAAKNGNGGAMETLWRMCRDGDGVAKSDEDALKWLKAAVEKGNGAALSALGDCYEHGSGGLSVNIDEAVSLYQQAADKKNPRGVYCLGLCYRDGKGVPKDELRAWKLIASCKVDNDLHYDDLAATALAEMYYGGSGLLENEKRFSAVDSELNMNSLRKIATRYKRGNRGLPRDMARAVECYTLAAERGEKTAQNSLGWMYYKGEGVECDPEKAFKWTMKAVENGNPYGMETLYRMYRDGVGVAKNDEEALKWLEIATKDPAEGGTATSELGECYEKGMLGLVRNEKTAFQLYYVASQKENCQAMFNRGRCHLMGIGTPIDVALAVNWLGKAAAENDIDDNKYDIMAMKLLVDLYSEGKLMAKDDAKAQAWQAKLDELNKKRMEEIRGYVSPV